MRVSQKNITVSVIKRVFNLTFDNLNISLKCTHLSYKMAFEKKFLHILPLAGVFYSKFFFGGTPFIYILDKADRGEAIL